MAFETKNLAGLLGHHYHINVLSLLKIRFYLQFCPHLSDTSRFMKSKFASSMTHTHATLLQLFGFCLGQPRWAGTRRNIHPLTPIVVISHPLSASSIYYDPWHLPCSIYVPDSLFPQFFQVFFGLPLGLAPSTSYSIHFCTQSLSSFCSICPYHRSLFCCSTEIMPSNPSPSTLYLELYHSLA